LPLRTGTLLQNKTGILL